MPTPHDHRPPHPTSHARAQRQLADAVEVLDRILVQFPHLWAAVVDALAGQPGAQDTQQDRTSGHTTVVDEHGTPMPARTDPTGEAACRVDPAAADLRQLRRDCAQIALVAERIIATFARYQARAANEYERAQSAGGDDGCQSCARVMGRSGLPQWTPVEQGVRLNGDVVKVCRWCRSWISRNGAMPDRKTITDHLAGKRIKQPA